MKFIFKPQVCIENGFYLAEVIEINSYRGNWGPCLAVLLKISGSKADGQKLKVVLPQSVTYKNKTGKFLKACGQEIAAEGSLETVQLIGKQIIIKTQLVEGIKQFFSKVIEFYQPTEDLPVERIIRN